MILCITTIVLIRILERLDAIDMHETPVQIESGISLQRIDSFEWISDEE